jgi:hypothetical protein
MLQANRESAGGVLNEFAFWPRFAGPTFGCPRGTIS